MKIDKLVVAIKIIYAANDSNINLMLLNTSSSSLTRNKLDLVSVLGKALISVHKLILKKNPHKQNNMIKG